MNNYKSWVIEGIQVNFKSLARVPVSDKIVLYFLLAGQSGVCTITNMFCCILRNSSGQVERSIQKLKEKDT